MEEEGSRGEGRARRRGERGEERGEEVGSVRGEEARGSSVEWEEEGCWGLWSVAEDGAREGEGEG